MTYRYNHRAISLLLVFALLVSLFPGGILTVYTTAAEVSDSDYTAAEEKTAEFNGYFPVPVSDEPSAVSNPFDTDCQQLQQSEVADDLLLVIAEAYYNADTDCLWYRVDAAPGYTLPAKLSKYSWVFQDYVKNPMGASLLIHEPCLTDTASGVQVLSDLAFPVGAKLSVGSTDVSSQLAQYGVDSSKLVFGLDIQVLNADSSQWQPEKGVTVKVPVSAAPGTTIGLLHTHEGKTSYLGATVVLSDGTVEFSADGFSAFAGFTVDFHYNDIDYSIGGLTDILLSELFTVLEIDRNAAHAIDVVFSDPTLVSVTRQEGDWLLTSLKAFTTGETLTITFSDGEIIVIDVTDWQYDYDVQDGNSYHVAYANGSGQANWDLHINRDNLPLTVTLTRTVGSLGWNYPKGKEYITTSEDGRKLTVKLASYIPLGNNVFDIDATVGGHVYFYFFEYIDVTYSDGGKNASNMPGKTNVKTYGTITLASNLPTAAGYTFAHWLGNDGKTYSPGATVTVDGDVSFTAVWTTNTNTAYKVQHWQQKANGGTEHNSTNYALVAGDTQNLTGTTGASVTPNVKTYTGFTSPSTQTVTIAADGSTVVNYYYTRNKYTVSFNANKGSGAPANQTKTYGVNLTLSSTKPTRTGYTFTGWNTKADGSGTSYAAGGTYSVNAAATLYAQWSANPNTAYKVQHWQQTVTGGSEKNSTNYTLVTGDTQNLTGATGASVTPAVKSYTGFKSPSAQTVTIAADGSTVVNYYYDRESYSVTLNKGTGISTVSGAGTYRYGASVTISAALADGYNWSSWTGTHSTTDQSYTFTMPASNVTDTANAAIKTYQVTYQGNGATGGSTGPQTFNHGSSVSIAANGFTKNGYHFTGWNTKADGSGTKYAANAVYSTNAALTLYAQWEINTYTVTYVLGFEGTSNITTNASAFPDQTKTHGVVLTLHSGTEPTATGYQFKGWNTKADGSGKSYALGEVYDIDADLTLYAQWDPTPYTVTYVINGLPADKASKFEVQYAPINTEVQLHQFSFDGYDRISIAAATEKDSQAVAISNGKITMTGGNVVVTITYKAIDYTITYSGLDGAVVIENPATYTVEDTITLHNPTKEGYDFVGWTGTGLTSATKTVTIPAGSTGDRAYTATWTEKTYTVTYYANNGSGTSQAVDSFTHGSSVKIAGNLFTNGNSQFVRWNTKPDGSGRDYEPGTVYSVNADLDLYAVWGYQLSVNVHSIVDGQDMLEGYISYQGDSWGSTATAVWPADALTGQSLVFTSGEDRIICSVKVVVNGTTIVEQAVNDQCPYAHSYTFTEALSKDTTIDVYFYARRVSLNAEIDRGSVYCTVAGDSNLYPWQTVHCNPGEHKGATVVFCPATGYGIETVTINGEAVTNPILNADGSYTYEIGDDGITEDTTITVTTTLNGYTITYDLDGGTVVPENPTAYDVTSPAITLKNPTKEGYTFAGWTGTGLSGATMNVTIPAGSIGDRQYTATWTENTVTIHYETVGPNGATNFGSVNPTTQTVGVVTGQPSSTASVSSNVYKFVGWFDTDGNLLSQNATYNPAPVNGFHVAATYIAKFEYNLTSLTIEKGGWNTADANQTFLFHVRGLDDGVDLMVTIHGDGSVIIDGLTVGYRYTITEMTDWSWRYHTSGWSHGAENGAGNSATITIGVQGRIVFANNRGIFQWLDGDSWLDNLFNGN